MAKQIIIVRERPIEGVINDLSMFGTAAAMMGLGVYFVSSAMQWFGFCSAVLLLISKASGSGKRTTFTIAEARKRLDEIEQAEGRS